MTSPNCENASARVFSVVEKDIPTIKLLVTSYQISLTCWGMPEDIKCKNAGSYDIKE